ncbi:MAG: hypothetical protein FJ267_09675, partial [Planctomycetes bacterium]|nr:hypothetical protein [Planctomycetota bacterium]
IRDTSSVLEGSVTALTEARQILTQAREIALDVNDASHDPAADEAFANQIDVALTRLIGVANQRLTDGRALFGGAASANSPYEVVLDPATGRPSRVTYKGSQFDSEAIVNQGLSFGTLIAGSRVFESRLRGATIFSGTTGAKAGTGTDSASGIGALVVARTGSTTYSNIPSSGIAAGTSSNTGDTIVGPSGSHQLVINDTSGTAASGTISLNGGPSISFTNADTNLKLTGPKGEVVYVNTSSIAAGFNGQVNLGANATLSTDGGATSTPVDFTSSNQVVKNSLTGEVTNVDSTAIRYAGTDRLTYPGTSDVFETLIQLRDAIRNPQGMSTQQRSEIISSTINDLDRQIVGVIDTMGVQSVKAENLKFLEERTADVQLKLQNETDVIENVDLTKAVTELTKEQNLYQIGLQITARINSLSLADFL